MAHIYILKSLRNGRYYIGSTNDLGRRLSEHNMGKSKYTSLIRPFKLVFSQGYSNNRTARRIEYKLKNFKNKNILERIISDGYIKIKDD